LRYTSRGPYVIEVAARLGGDRIPYITKLSSGIDVVAASAASVTGGKVNVTPTIGRVAGIRMIYPEYDGVVRALGVSDAREKIWTEIGWWATVGQRVQLPPRSFTSRLAYVMAVGDSREEVQRRLDAAEDALQIVVEAD
jgi:biotin carboxylase